MEANTSAGKENIEKFSPTKIISSGKDLVALLRDAFLFILIIMLIFLPERLNKKLTEAGFTEANIGGLKWQAETITDLSDVVNESQVTINNLQAQLDSTTKLLAEVQTKTSDPELKQKLEEAKKDNQAVNE